MTRLASAILLGCLLACSKPGPPAVTVTNESVYAALVEAGCLASEDGGVAYVQQEHSLPDQPAWLACLYDGGTVAGCGVPCDQ